MSTKALETNLVPTSEISITAAVLRERGRGIGYTKSPFAHLFTRVA